MFRNRLYYQFKPLVPWSTRMGLRRWLAARQRARVGAEWPIYPGSEKLPANWPGWPEGRQFALVLSHDVEGSAGVNKVRPLAELEMRLGFRSSFNFIPQGGYPVPKELRDWLTANGFEVGVHDLRHDGKLYRNREEFRDNAALINQHARAWGAVGFRSGFMLHELDWLHDLEVQYDASTFDTDPFEPQPNGQHTIFPFWVPNPNPPSRISDQGSAPAAGQPAASSPLSSSPNRFRSGYVELPYTLPQDSTLFLLLRESTPAIWLQKLDWIARNGGMALVNVHPDYVRFDGEAASGHTFPVEFYAQLLQRVRDEHPGRCWQVLPRDLTAWFRAAVQPDSGVPAPETAVRSELKGKKAAVLLYSYYPSDPRPRREAEALVKEGMEVDLLCLREKPDEPVSETINGVRVRRVPLRRRREGKLTYISQYAAFTAICAALLAGRSLRRRYDLVHVHNMPDVLVLAALVPKLLGARVILDLHDPMPELMMTIYGLRPQSPVVGLLRFLEKCSIGFADRVVTVNLACKKIFGARSCAPEKIEVVMNSPDESVFRFQPCAQNGAPGRDPAKPFIVMCHGSIVERHGHDLAVAAIAQVRRSIPSVQLHIYGRRTAFLDEVMASVQERQLDEVVRYQGVCDQAGIVAAISGTDVGIIPNRRAIFTELNTPTRIFEYLACGVPVISPRAPGILDYFSPAEMIYFELGDADDLARRIEYVYHHPTEARDFVRRGQAVYQAYQWSEERARLVRMTDGLLSSRRSRRASLTEVEK